MVAALGCAPVFLRGRSEQTPLSFPSPPFLAGGGKRKGNSSYFSVPSRPYTQEESKENVWKKSYERKRLGLASFSSFPASLPFSVSN